MTVFGRRTGLDELEDRVKKLRRLSEALSESEGSFRPIMTHPALKDALLLRRVATLEEEVENLARPLRSLVAELNDYLRKNKRPSPS